jgi:hypothetical protein
MSLDTSNLIFVSNARASFPWLVSPQEQTNDKGEKSYSYSCDLILSPNDPSLAKFMQIYAALAAEKWKENANAAMQQIHSDKRTRCYGQGDEKKSQKTFQVHPGYAGNSYITARHTNQPQIIDTDGKAIDPSNTLALRAVASKIYGGAYVNAVIKPWIQANTKGIGIRCELVAIQFSKDGEAFGAGAPADVSNMFSTTSQTPNFMAPTGATTNPFAPAQPAAPAFAMPGLPSFM